MSFRPTLGRDGSLTAAVAVASLATVLAAGSAASAMSAGSAVGSAPTSGAVAPSVEEKADKPDKDKPDKDKGEKDKKDKDGGDAPAAPACALPEGPQVVHTWEGTAPTAAGGVGTADPVLDTFSLPADCAISAVTVTVRWDLFAEDLDLEVTDPAGTTVASETGNTTSGEASETVDVAALSGTYTSAVASWANVETPFTGEVVAVIAGDAVAAPEEPVEEPVDGPAAEVPSDPGAARTVVADLDSAINPYHDAFYAGGLYYPDTAPSAVTQEVLAELGVAPENVVRLTRTGDFAADFAADQAFWESVQPQTPYHFLGTNIIASSFAPADTPGGYLQPNAEKSSHGVGTAASVLAANPETVLYFLEVDSNLGSEESHAEGFLNPAVDIVTTSYGISIPSTGFPIPEANAFEHTYDGVVEQGKLHFSSGGNGPGLTPLRAGAGPWWSIGVSGIEEGSSNGQTTTAGRFPDFVSDFSQDIPYCHECESGIRKNVGGTSFSTPRAAGVASRVLLEARRAAGHTGGITTVDGVPTMVGDTTNFELRRALEQAAHVPGTSDYDPVEAVFDLGALPVNDAAPWAQVGWGDLTAAPEKDVVPAALRALGGEDLGKDGGFCDFQTAVIEVRMAYWNEVAPFVPPITGEQVPGAPAENPFVYC